MAGLTINALINTVMVQKSGMNKVFVILLVCNRSLVVP